ncbi:hypothetical protein Goarm_017132 [Gossypium armourianum]|uniref:Peptidase A1 domain-containing protein n=1 Tax=Gossypium armourianum TaxID=34283 RepID=A0A7J9JGZ5_9ROSI|nr:hypothetical protein [Gossypium armourianum]
MTVIVNPPSLLHLVSTILLLSSLTLTLAQTTGFSVELIPRDSPKSPFYNPMETTSDCVTNALRRSFSSVGRFKSSFVLTEWAQSDITVGSGEYLMNISIGTPAFDTVAIVDTASDLIWTKCKPCSYNNSCQYSINYPDDSYSNGDLAFDTITLATTTSPTVSVLEIVIGCGHNNGGPSKERNSGVIGLGGGELSLISQIGSPIAGKFSYCLLPTSEKNESSKLNFGSNAIVSGDGVVSTPLVKLSSPTFYFLNLKAISVGNKRINYTDVSLGKPGEGNIIIDLGTTLILFPSGIYWELESAVATQINATRVQGPEGLSLCYDAKTEFVIPNITMHFTGADVKLQRLNTFFTVLDTVTCFAFGSFRQHSVYGNLAQINFLIGYDIEKKTVSFKPTDCSKN